MAQESLARNPFMLMLHPEVVLAAMEGSEKLGRLNRRLCHPLDRQMPAAAGGAPAMVSFDDEVDQTDD